LPKICDKIIADTHIDTAYKKYCQYLHQYSKSIANTIGSNTNTAILTTLLQSQTGRKHQHTIATDIQLLQMYKMSNVGRDPLYHVVTERQLPQLVEAIQSLQRTVQFLIKHQKHWTVLSK